MGFMDQFRQPQQTKPNQLSEIIDTARQFANNDPRTTVQTMADNGMVCSLPNGKSMPVKDMLAMAEGKTAMQFLTELGL